MKVIAKGVPIVSGLAIGVAKVWKEEDVFNNISSNCRSNNNDFEIRKLKNALEVLNNKVNNYLEFIKNERKELKEINDILNAYLLIADSIVEEAIDKIKSDNVCAELAVKVIIEKYIQKLRESGSELISMRVDDLIDIESQLIRIMLGKPLLYDLLINQSRDNIILITNDIMPSTILLLARSGLVGLVTKHGGITSHSAILARTFNIPYILVPSLDIESIGTIINDKAVIVDGYKGYLLLPDINESYTSLMQIANIIKNINDKFFNERAQPAVTEDGHNIKVLANVNNIEDARIVLDYGGEGIGLLRLEFMYMNRKQPPNENELLSTLQKISEFVHKREIIVRALDAGGDKPIPYLNISKENNPFLGLRGIRLLLKEHQDILIDEIRAVLRASSFGEFGFMIPMVSTLSEIIETKKIMNEVKEDLERKGINYGKVSFGIMVEIPSIALIIDKVMNYVDFVSIGTNDLTQYILAADRDNEKVQYLYNEFHPSVLRLLYNVVNTAKRHGVRVDVCGEMASNEIAIPILLSLGVDALSVNITSIPKIKYIVRKLNIGKIRNSIMELINNFSNEGDVRELVMRILMETITELTPLMKIYESYENSQQP